MQFGKKNIYGSGFASLGLIAVVALVAAVGVTVFTFTNTNVDPRIQAVESTRLAVLLPENNQAIVNEDGNEFTTGGNSWIGNGQSVSKSYFGLLVTGDSVPKGATVTKAELKFVQPKDEWIGLSVKAQIQDSASPANFSSSSRPSSRSLLPENSTFSEDTKWSAGQTYSINITSAVQGFVNKYGGNKMAVILKGVSSGPWGRKFIYNGGTKPKLEVTYVVSGSSTTQPSATSSPVVTVKPSGSASPIVTIRPTSSPRPVLTATPTPKPTLAPTQTPAPTAPPTIAPTNQPIGGSSGIFGAVPAGSLGTCTAEVHDRYVTTGPDGNTYRTWHPNTVPVSANNPNGAICGFGHEHGDNPSTSNVDKTMPPFGYIARQIGMDEPHVGFKVAVVNRGFFQDGSEVLIDSRAVFHTGTGGPARFTARFHSMQLAIRHVDGKSMSIQGMGDTGGVNTICESRIGKTVLGLGCVVDSPYEIWEFKLPIRNQGQTVANGIISTAVFDPITVMDPKDKTRLIYTSSAAANPIFRFNDSRAGFGGCGRENYHGPAHWYNGGGSEVFYTDAYGNAATGGPLRQQVSRHNTDFGPATQGLGFIATYSGGNRNDPRTQALVAEDYCSPSIGLLN